MTKTRKNVPWRGWKKMKPGYHQKTVMFKKCGKKCFLGKGKSFPICKKIHVRYPEPVYMLLM